MDAARQQAAGTRQARPCGGEQRTAQVWGTQQSPEGVFEELLRTVEACEHEVARAGAELFLRSAIIHTCRLHYDSNKAIAMMRET